MYVIDIIHPVKNALSKSYRLLFFNFQNANVITNTTIPITVHTFLSSTYPTSFLGSAPRSVLFLPFFPSPWYTPFTGSGQGRVHKKGRSMDKTTILNHLDESIENFKKDMALFSEDSSRPVTENDLYKRGFWHDGGYLTMPN